MDDYPLVDRAGVLFQEVPPSALRVGDLLRHEEVHQEDEETLVVFQFRVESIRTGEVSEGPAAGSSWWVFYGKHASTEVDAEEGPWTSRLLRKAPPTDAPF